MKQLYVLEHHYQVSALCGAYTSGIALGYHHMLKLLRDLRLKYGTGDLSL